MATSVDVWKETALFLVKSAVREVTDTTIPAGAPEPFSIQCFSCGNIIKYSKFSTAIAQGWRGVTVDPTLPNLPTPRVFGWCSTHSVGCLNTLKKGLG